MSADREGCAGGGGGGGGGAGPGPAGLGGDGGASNFVMGGGVIDCVFSSSELGLKPLALPVAFFMSSACILDFAIRVM